MQAPFAAHLVLEVLHRIGEKNLDAADSGSFQRPVENPSGRTDKGLAGEIFLISRLLADQHQRRACRPFARHHLCGREIQRTSRVFGLRLAQGGKRLNRQVALGLVGRCHHPLRARKPIRRIGLESHDPATNKGDTGSGK